MSPDTVELFRYFIIFITLIFITGIYCILASFNLVRALIGLEILIKAVTLLIILAGYICGRIIKCDFSESTFSRRNHNSNF